MKVIGTSSAGNPIVELEQGSRQALAEAGRILLGIGQIGVGDTVVVPHVYVGEYAQSKMVAEKVKRHYKKRATKAEVLDTTRDKVCKICGKKFHDNSPRNTLVTYEKASCQLQHKREYQRAWYDKHRKVGKKTAAAAPAPAAKPYRIAMLKSINTRISDRGPIDEVTALAGRLASEEGRG